MDFDHSLYQMTMSHGLRAFIRFHEIVDAAPDAPISGDDIARLKAGQRA